MTLDNRPLIVSAPYPRTLDLIFSPERKAQLFEQYRILEMESEDVNNLNDDIISEITYIIGQPPLDEQFIQKASKLRCIFNVESNLIDNMPYPLLFERGIHVVTTGQVFALPVAELGVALALALKRDLINADLMFREGNELWGGDGNANASLLSGATVGIIGFGDLGKALNQLLKGFRAKVQSYDPWLPESLLKEHEVAPADLDTLLSTSDVIFVVASVTSENQHFLNKSAFSKMKAGSAFILLSRANIVNFEDLMDAVESKHIVAASDVFPEEPLPLDHPVRKLDGFVRSAHRAGALDVAFLNMGEMVMEDLKLLDQNLPPQRCKRAERETVSRMRSKPVTTN
ncbi:putative 2-hydroxyacid dehydrogenase [Vibrio nigripulchritudo MADA3029]|uniref:hydroxyacid dehydrogenase n=1 Tax=Vibrio nigripulchritudo TaxID=28173 RepID=UPI0003B213D1|nr:hydroxyacid dehydrogenase [Vibrio nigripulchritudo]CCN48691.1 putative 2-hydroxyacid dehydrogenase [Vibrio nigripulchritudo MADA3020]CCN52754.1 putative 2-hydroxyacid dehydrogenase [Vibrio nigripulchritudo MADA3021]CCN57755.1 putative 2-hydroxyacid dehydrogenase [Vibrio nigripulchritudo MADA3029]